MIPDLGRAERDAIITKVIGTVEKKHFDPKFEKDHWRAAVEARRSEILEAPSAAEFETALDDLVRSVGTPDSGFFHESHRKKVPKGIAARFQYCQPNECAPE